MAPRRIPAPGEEGALCRAWGCGGPGGCARARAQAPGGTCDRLSWKGPPSTSAPPPSRTVASGLPSENPLASPGSAERVVLVCQSPSTGQGAFKANLRARHRRRHKAESSIFSGRDQGSKMAHLLHPPSPQVLGGIV
uniref:Uncharacterized protein n=1 Tax=Myotis myotis TaxID=51298 RepID=A0A7J7T6F9_MYOMY|nr:hypothetical protein mMyoMyo1_009125 [Myotis myotis]